MKSILTIVVGLLALMSSALYAGATSRNTGVSIDLDEGVGVASGVMWATRSSKNDVETIGCAYSGIDSYNWASRAAVDADGLYLWCFTENPHMIDVIRAISPFSWVRFRFENATYNEDDERWESDCTQINISTRSQHLPEFTTKGK